MFADFVVEFFYAVSVFFPEVFINRKEILENFESDTVVFEAFDIDIFSFGEETDGAFNSVNGACNSAEDPKENAEVIAEAGPDEFAFIVGSEPVNVEDLRRIGDLFTHFDPVSPVVAHVVTTDGKHSHRVTTNYADSTCSCCCGFGSHCGANVNAVVPVEGLIYEGCSLSTTAAEYDSIDGNACGIVEFFGNAGAVFSHSGETGVGMSAFGAIGAIPFITEPVVSICRGIFVETFPPNSVVIEVMNNVGENGFSFGCVESVGVRLEVGTGSNAEEAVFGVNCPKTSVGTYTEPSDVVAYAPYFIALFSINFGRNKHCEVCLTASRGESCADIVDLTVRIFNTEDEHMFSKPTFFMSEVRCNSESETFFTEENVSAVTGVNGADEVFLGEMNDITVFFVDIFLSMETLNEISIVTESIDNFFACTGHNEHVKNNVDRVGKLDTDLSKRRFYHAHGVRNNVHGSANHTILIKSIEGVVHFFGVTPVVDVACFFFCFGADEGSVFYTCNVILCGSVEITAGKFFLVEFDDFACSASFFTKCVSLFIRSVDPNYFVGIAELDLLVNPCENSFILCHFEPFPVINTIMLIIF